MKSWPRLACLVSTSIVLVSCAVSMPTPTSIPRAAELIPVPPPVLTPTLTPILTPTPPRELPNFVHAYVIVMENDEYTSIVGSPDAPYLNSLIQQYGIATAYTGVAHPSEPNYLALFSGSTQGVTDDANHNIDGQNL